MTTWAELLNDLRFDLRDTATSKRWGDELLYLYAKDAIRDYSIYFPMRVHRTALTVTDSYAPLPSDVIDVVPLARRTIQKRFRAVLGRTILDEIRHARIEVFSQMLTETDLSIAQIAMACGFPGIDHVSRSFRRIKHMSPLAYRKHYGRRQ